MRNRHQRRGNQRPRRAPYAVIPMQQPQHERAVLQAAAEDVAHGDVDGDAEADEEEGRDDDAKGRSGDEGDVGACHEHLAEADELGAAEFGTEGVEAEGGEDEAEGLADEDEGDDGIANVIVPGIVRFLLHFFHF